MKNSLSSRQMHMANKYRNKKVVVNGVVYDSKKEQKRHAELLLLERAGEIHDLQTQVKFVLIPKQYSKTEFTKAGKPKVAESECTYRADFAYFTKDGEYVVEDTKNPYLRKEPRYRIKKKLMLYVHGIEIKEV